MDKKTSSKQISIKLLERELNELKYKKRYVKELLHTIYMLVVISAVAILLATLVFPVLRISGNSMTPTYHDNDLVVALNGGKYEQGDIIVFYYNNEVLVKRIIASESQWVDIDEDGNVYVDDILLEEDYAIDKDLGQCDIKLPYQVPSESYFVMGDHRSTSMDSRLSVIGCIDTKQVVGKILFKL